MKNDRTTNSLRNILFGFIQKTLQVILPFILRSSIIYSLGIEYVGLNSLFTAVLTVLNLSELGVGTAIVYSMYKPINDHNADEICALMVLYRRYYRIIGIAVLLLGLVLLPFIPTFISGDVPADINIYVLYLMYLLNTVVSYWLFAYRNSVIVAHQRSDVVNKIQAVVLIGQFILQMAVLVIFRNFYLFTVILFLSQISVNVATAARSVKMYPRYTPHGSLPKKRIREINRNILDVLTSLAVYSNYMYIMKAVSSFFAIGLASLAASIGNSIVSDSKTKLYADFKELAFIVFWASGFCAICMLCLYQPVVLLWVGPEYMEGIEVVVLICILFVLIQIASMHAIYKDAGGIWKQDRFRPLACAVVSLSLSLLLVRFQGLTGVIAALVFTYAFVAIPWSMRNLFTSVFFRSAREYVLYMVRFLLCIVAAGAFTYGLCGLIRAEGIAGIALRLMACLTAPNLIFFLAFGKTNEFRRALRRVKTTVVNLRA